MTTVPARSLILRLHRSPMGTLAEAAREAAEDRAEPLYLVGGCVRDLFLGVPLRDLDLTVEGVARALATEIASRTGGRVAAESRFGTCRVEGPGGTRIDIATARRERYRHPAALPEVEAAGIEEDLHRRDFTINAMAIGLTGPDAGRLLDPAGGRRDLRARRLKLLHAGSLVDDPTRAYRGSRYAARFSLRTTADWSRSVGAARRAGSFRRLTAARLLRELALIWAENGPEAALSRCGRWGILGATHPGLSWRPALAAAVRRASSAWAPRSPGAYEPLIVLLLWSLPPRQRRGLCTRLGLAGAAREALLEAAAAPWRACRLLQGLPEPPGNERAFRRLEEVSGWSLLAVRTVEATAPAPLRRLLERARDSYEEARPLLGGDEVVEMGVRRGPAVRLFLRRLRRERLERPALSREEEAALVRSWLRQRRASRP